jgi:hypothetical protein
LKSFHFRRRVFALGRIRADRRQRSRLGIDLHAPLTIPQNKIDTLSVVLIYPNLDLLLSPLPIIGKLSEIKALVDLPIL